MTKKLGATLHEVNIQDAVRVHFRDIGHSEEKHDVTYENAQARERTQVLIDIANQTGGMVIGTGDMSELALGWATFSGYDPEIPLFSAPFSRSLSHNNSPFLHCS